jgi:hypothetical protein
LSLGSSEHVVHEVRPLALGLLAPVVLQEKQALSSSEDEVFDCVIEDTEVLEWFPDVAGSGSGVGLPFASARAHKFSIPASCACSSPHVRAGPVHAGISQHLDLTNFQNSGEIHILGQDGFDCDDEGLTFDGFADPWFSASLLSQVHDDLHMPEVPAEPVLNDESVFYCDGDDEDEGDDGSRMVPVSVVLLPSFAEDDGVDDEKDDEDDGLTFDGYADPLFDGSSYMVPLAASCSAVALVPDSLVDIVGGGVVRSDHKHSNATTQAGKSNFGGGFPLENEINLDKVAEGCHGVIAANIAASTSPHGVPSAYVSADVCAGLQGNFGGFPVAEGSHGVIAASIAAVPACVADAIVVPDVTDSSPQAPGSSSPQAQGRQIMLEAFVSADIPSIVDAPGAICADTVSYVQEEAGDGVDNGADGELLIGMLNMFQAHLKSFYSASPKGAALSEYKVYWNLAGSSLPAVATDMIRMLEDSGKHLLVSRAKLSWDLARCRGVLFSLRLVGNVREFQMANSQTNRGCLCCSLVEAVVHEWSRESLEEWLSSRLGLAQVDLESVLD